MKLDPIYNEKPTDLDFLENKETPLTEAEATYYLREAWRSIYGIYPSMDSLSILWAQSALETGRWKFLRCSNWGNIKRRKDIKWTSYEASEYLMIDGVKMHMYFYPYHPQTHFAAWDDALSGAIGYIRFVSGKKRYEKAWVELLVGDPVAYCRELRAGGYFTAPLDKYTAVVVKLVNEFKRRSDELLAWEQPELIEPVEIEPELPEEPVDVTEEPVPEVAKESDIIIKGEIKGFLKTALELVNKIINVLKNIFK